MEFTFLGVGALSEDVEDQLGAVDYPDRYSILRVLLLKRSRSSPTDHGCSFKFLNFLVQFFGFARTDVKRRVGSLPFLVKLTYYNGSGAFNKLPELIGIPFYILRIRRIGHNDQRTFSRFISYIPVPVLSLFFWNLRPPDFNIIFDSLNGFSYPFAVLVACNC